MQARRHVSAASKDDAAMRVACIWSCGHANDFVSTCTFLKADVPAQLQKRLYTASQSIHANRLLVLKLTG